MVDDPREPPDEPGDPADSGADDGDLDDLPESPFTTEDVRFSVGDELLAVVLRSADVRNDRIRADLAADFLTRLERLVFAIAGVLAGRPSGRRGTLRRPAGVRGLALAGLDWGSSAVFHFGLADDEEMRLSMEGEIVSPTEQAIATLARLLQLSASGAEERLLAETRSLSPRVAVNLGLLLEVITDNEVDTVWRTSRNRRAIDLDSQRAARAHTILGREALPATEVIDVTGLLYEAHARRHGFEILIEQGYDKEVMRGTYDPELRDVVRNAWDRRVRVRVRVTRLFLQRQEDPFDTRVELLEVLDYLPDEV